MNYGYIRVSSDKQTVENQRLEINRYCSVKNVCVDEWIEESVSGVKHPDVRKLGNILRRIKKGDTIMVTEISRLGRNAYMVIAIISHCLIAKANILEIRDDRYVREDSNSAQDVFFKVLHAQKEREDISRRTIAGLARVRAEGRKLGREMGTKNSKYKLTGYEEDIIYMLSIGKSKASICRKYGVHKATLLEHLKRINYSVAS